ncbi:MAG: tRNA-(ms[2]io[6]A)-hydroxylase [Gammaproteobacteria bacterium]|nr:tRNA-(ms[2]io[6]A)-hydroxylase [Gammaproteobacteria bacterium]
MDTVETLLNCETPSAWVSAALENPDLLLIDHAHCEKKAASSALKLMFRYPEQQTLVVSMSRLAREELRHFEQVTRIMRRRGIAYRHLTPSRYAAGLRRHVRTYEPGHLVDLLIIGAFIEARSCERFAKLVPVLDEELAGFYEGLRKSESRHFLNYISLAKTIAEEDIAPRVAEFAEIEASLIREADDEFRFHSGVPQAA